MRPLIRYLGILVLLNGHSLVMLIVQGGGGLISE
jgi:hypothetical protein